MLTETPDLYGKPLLGPVQDGRVDMSPLEGRYAVQLRLDLHHPRLKVASAGHKQDRLTATEQQQTSFGL